MGKKKSNAGRPRVDIQDYLVKISPYLKCGLSLNKACIQAKIPYRTVNDYINADDNIRKDVEWLLGYADWKAQNNIHESIENGNAGDSRWWLERRNKQFSAKVEQTNTNIHIDAAKMQEYSMTDLMKLYKGEKVNVIEGEIIEEDE